MSRKEPDADEIEVPDYVSEEYCMCGVRMDQHTQSDNHSPLSEADYYRDRQRAKKQWKTSVHR